MTVTRTGSVADYQREFIERANPLGKIDEPYSSGSFLKGLKDDVRKELRVHGPITWKEAMT